MAFNHPPGLNPPEIAFVCEMELVTIIPRQRLDRLDLLGVSDPWRRMPSSRSECLSPPSKLNLASNQLPC
jgi:hypothetical protein